MAGRREKENDRKTEGTDRIIKGEVPCVGGGKEKRQKWLTVPAVGGGCYSAPLLLSRQHQA
jgi:hypothetical protein